MHKKLIDFSRQIARMTPIWTQGAGSNISEKTTSENLWIKSSGTRLDQVSSTTGLVELNYIHLRKQIGQISSESESTREIRYSDCIKTSQVSEAKTGRPSMEAGFHALAKEKWVLHFHSLPAIIMGFLYFSSRDSKIKSFFEKFKLSFVPLVKPGWELSLKLIAIKEGFYILESHGLIVSSNDFAVLNQWDKIEDEFLNQFGYTELAKIKQKIAKGELTDWSPFKSGPLKFYFPDMAIYYRQLQPHLVESKYGVYELSDDAPLDTKEVWWATQILNQTEPKLQEIPSSMLQEITQLPTEKIRQSYFKG